MRYTIGYDAAGDGELLFMEADDQTPEDQSFSEAEIEDFEFLYNASGGDAERALEALAEIQDFSDDDTTAFVRQLEATGGDLDASFAALRQEAAQTEEQQAVAALDEYMRHEGIDHREEYARTLEAAGGNIELATAAYRSTMDQLAAAKQRMADDPPAPLHGMDKALIEAQDEGLVASESRWQDRDRARNDDLDNALSDVLEDMSARRGLARLADRRVRAGDFPT